MADGYGDDETLLRGFTLGEREAFDEIFNRYWPRLYHTAFKLIRQRDDSKDVVIVVLNNLFTGHRRFQNFAQLNAYLYVAVRNRCLDYLRAQKRYSDAEKEYRQETEADEVNDQLDAEWAVILYKSVSKLPEGYKTVVLLYYGEGLKYREIAAKLNISHRTVESQLRKALEHLRRSLADSRLELGLPVVLFSLVAGLAPVALWLFWTRVM